MRATDIPIELRGISHTSSLPGNCTATDGKVYIHRRRWVSGSHYVGLSNDERRGGYQVDGEDRYIMVRDLVGSYDDDGVITWIMVQREREEEEYNKVHDEAIQKRRKENEPYIGIPLRSAWNGKTYYTSFDDGTGSLSVPECNANIGIAPGTSRETVAKRLQEIIDNKVRGWVDIKEE
jgi:hypothetical protein